MYRKRIVAVMVVCVLALVGCTPGGSGGENTNTNSSRPLALPSAKDFSGHISYWSWRAKDDVDSEIAQFHKIYPNIQVTYKKLQNYPQDIQQLTAGLLSANGPDVYDLGDSYYRQFLPYMQDLTPLARQSLGSDWTDEMAHGARSAFSIDGKLMVAPFGVEYQGAWLVNRTMLDQLGLDMPTNMSPTELQQWCNALHKANKQCLLLGNQVPTLGQAVVQTIASQESPGAWASAVEGTGSWNKLKNSFAQLTALQEAGFFQPGSVNAAPYPDLWEDFKQQKAAAILLGSWTLPYYDKTNWSDELGPKTKSFIPELIVPAGFSKTESPQMPSVTTGIAINSKSQNLEAASAFVSWMSFSKQGAQFMANTVSPVSALNGVTPAYDYADPSVQEPSFKAFFNAARGSNEHLGIHCAGVLKAVNQAVEKSLTGKDPGVVTAQLQADSDSAHATCAAQKTP